MNKKTSVLVLGGEGFIGRNIGHFLPYQKYSVTSLGVEKSIFNEIRKDEFVEIDPYRERVAGEFDAVVHLIDNASFEGDEFERKERSLIENINLKKVGHLVLFSSAVVYANPDSDYGKRKQALEGIYEKYCDKNGIKLTIFRLFNIYGPYQLPFKQGSLVANIFCNHLNDKETEIYDMTAKRDFIYSKDMVKFIEYVIENSVGGRFDLATNNLVTVGEVVKKIEMVMGEKLQIKDSHNKENIICPMAQNPFVNNIILSSFEDGLKESFEFYQNNINTINKVIK